MNAVTVARSFPRKNVIYGGGARVQRGRGKRERGRKIGERWRNEKDTHRVFLEILEGRGAETIQKGRNNERSSLKGYFSRNSSRFLEGKRRERGGGG